MRGGCYVYLPEATLSVVDSGADKERKKEKAHFEFVRLDLTQHAGKQNSKNTCV